MLRNWRIRLAWCLRCMVWHLCINCDGRAPPAMSTQPCSCDSARSRASRSGPALGRFCWGGRWQSKGTWKRAANASVMGSLCARRWGQHNLGRIFPCYLPRCMGAWAKSRRRWRCSAQPWRGRQILENSGVRPKCIGSRGSCCCRPQESSGAPPSALRRWPQSAIQRERRRCVFRRHWHLPNTRVRKDGRCGQH